jgi:hypothetical protein
MISPFLESSQTLGRPLIGETFPMLVVGIGAFSQGPVVDIAATPEGTGKDVLLFFGGIEPILVGFFPFHI